MSHAWWSKCNEVWLRCSAPPFWLPIPMTFTNISLIHLSRLTASPSNCTTLTPSFLEHWPSGILWTQASSHFPLWRRPRGLTTLSWQPSLRPLGPQFWLALLSRSPHTLHTSTFSLSCTLYFLSCTTLFLFSFLLSICTLWLLQICTPSFFFPLFPFMQSEPLPINRKA